MYQFDAIRDFYKWRTPDILKSFMKHPQKWCDVHTGKFNWHYMFSPIEKLTWCSLRFFGKAPMYPQYPVLDKYFLDFGNPAAKVGIECDGLEWHTDKENDFKRDKEILKEGWTIFRIGGADCYKVAEQHGTYEDRFFVSEENACYILKDFYTTIDGLIKAISFYYFDYCDYSLFKIEIPLAVDCLKNYISPAHLDNFHVFIENKTNELYNDYYTWKENL